MHLMASEQYGGRHPYRVYKHQRRYSHENQQADPITGIKKLKDKEGATKGDEGDSSPHCRIRTSPL